MELSVNFPVILAAALVPMIMGFIWYNPKTFGNAWMKAADMTEEKIKGSNMTRIFILAYIFSVLVAFTLQFMVIHQYHFYSVVADQLKPGDTSSDHAQWLQSTLDKYGSNFRTFKHGAFHGFLAAIFFALPVIGMNALFERKSGAYIWIHTGFWAACFILMGGILCQWA